jgi:hypothetical protein
MGCDGVKSGRSLATYRRILQIQSSDYKLFYHEDGCSKFFQIVGKDILDYTELHYRRQGIFTVSVTT